MQYFLGPPAAPPIEPMYPLVPLYVPVYNQPIVPAPPHPQLFMYHPPAAVLPPPMALAPPALQYLHPPIASYPPLSPALPFATPKPFAAPAPGPCPHSKPPPPEIPLPKPSRVENSETEEKSVQDGPTSLKPMCHMPSIPVSTVVSVASHFVTKAAVPAVTVTAPTNTVVEKSSALSSCTKTMSTSLPLKVTCATATSSLVSHPSVLITSQVSKNTSSHLSASAVKSSHTVLTTVASTADQSSVTKSSQLPSVNISTQPSATKLPPQVVVDSVFAPHKPFIQQPQTKPNQPSKSFAPQIMHKPITAPPKIFTQGSVKPVITSKASVSQNQLPFQPPNKSVQFPPPPLPPFPHHQPPLPPPQVVKPPPPPPSFSLLPPPFLSRPPPPPPPPPMRQQQFRTPPPNVPLSQLLLIRPPPPPPIVIDKAFKKSDQPIPKLNGVHPALSGVVAEQKPSINKKLQERSLCEPFASNPTVVPDEPKKKFSENKCEVCSVVMNSAFQAKNHYASRKHVMKVQKYLRKGADGTETNAKKSRLEDYESADHSSSSAEEDSDTVKWKGDASSSLVNSESADSYHPDSTSSPPKDKRFVCDICQVTGNSEPQFALHLQGARHRKRVSMVNKDKNPSNVAAATPQPPEVQNSSYSVVATVIPVQEEAPKQEITLHRTPSGSYYCHLCNFTVKTLSEYNQHLTSKKHLYNAKKLRWPLGKRVYV